MNQSDPISAHKEAFDWLMKYYFVSENSTKTTRMEKGRVYILLSLNHCIFNFQNTKKKCVW